jgi:hypothetical protein
LIIFYFYFYSIAEDRALQKQTLSEFTEKKSLSNNVEKLCYSRENSKKSSQSLRKSFAWKIIILLPISSLQNDFLYDGQKGGGQKEREVGTINANLDLLHNLISRTCYVQ